MVYHLGIRIQSVGRVLSTSVRSETILIPELQFTTLNTDLVLTCLESSKLIDFLKKTRWLDQVSDLTPIFQVRSQIPLFLLHPQNCSSLLLASAIVVTGDRKLKNNDLMSMFSLHYHIQILITIGDISNGDVDFLQAMTSSWCLAFLA